jgi:hypothetical protein
VKKRVDPAACRETGGSPSLIQEAENLVGQGQNIGGIDT